MKSNLLKFFCVAVLFLAGQTATGQGGDKEQADAYKLEFSKATEALNQKKFDDSITALNRCVELTRKMSEPHARQFLRRTLELLAYVHATDGNVEKAVDHWERLQNLILGANAPKVMVQKFNQHLEQRLKIKELDVSAPAAKQTAQNVFLQLAVTAATEDARDYSTNDILAALANMESVFGKGTAFEASLWFRLGENQFQTERFEDAIETFTKCRDLRKAIYGADHIETAKAHTYIGQCWWNLHDHQKAAKFIQEGADGVPPEYATFSADHAYTQLLCGRVITYRGITNQSVTYHNRAIESFRKADPGSPNLARTHASLSRVMTHIGNPIASMKNAQVARAHLDDVLVHPLEKNAYNESLSETKTALGDAYLIKNNYQRALKYFQENVVLLDEGVFPNRYAYLKSNSLQQQAIALFYLRRLDEAKEKIQEATKLYLASTDKGSRARPHLPYYLSVTGQIETALENFDKGLESLNEAEKLMAFTADHIVKSQIYRMKGFCYAGKDELATAAEFFNKAIDELWRHHSKQTMSLSVRDMVEFNKRNSSVLTSFHKVLDSSNDEQLLKYYQQIYRTKGSISRVIGSQNQAIHKLESDTQRDTLLSWLDKASSQLASSVFRHLQTKQSLADSIDEQLFDIRRKREELRLRNSNRFSSKEFSRLANVLGEDSALIDIYKLGEVDNDVEEFYIALIVIPQGEKLQIKLVELGDGKTIDNHIQRLLGGFGVNFGRDLKKIVGNKTEAGQSSEFLAKHVWQKIAPHLDDKTRIVICPDGRFGWMPWNALRDKVGNLLIENYQFALATDSQSVARYGEASVRLAAPSMSIVGGLEYGKRSASVTSKLNWKAIPFTRREIDAIGEALPPSVILNVYRQIDEAQLRELARNSQLLHIATHGFTLRDLINEDLPSSQKRLEWAVQFPFSTSGLVLSDANQIAANDENDGLMSGFELMHLDMSQVELAVLSACHSGGGLPTSGEGVFGIQRALHIAGAKATIASRWAVGDENTARFMARFYKNYFADRSLGKADALRQTQLEMHNEGMPVSDWASWALTGDWR